jgi:hypothetical protein
VKQLRVYTFSLFSLRMVWIFGCDFSLTEDITVLCSMVIVSMLFMYDTIFWFIDSLCNKL